LAPSSSTAKTTSADPSNGTIGVVFSFMIWFVAIGAVIVLGAVAGVTWASGRTVPGTLRPDQLVIGTTEPRARASQGWRPGCFHVNAPLASPISFTPMIRHKTVVITALRCPIQPLRLPHQVGRAW